MRKFELTAEAIGDLLEIWNFIARDNAEAAYRVEEAILRACDLLAGSPLSPVEREVI
jgi:plasmid stabilization system protein ParE